MFENIEMVNFNLCERCQALADSGAENVKSAKWITENLCYDCMRHFKIYSDHLTDLIDRMNTLPQEYSVTIDTKNNIMRIEIKRPVKLAI